MTYHGKVATVFGGTGFVGRHLVARLAKAGMVVRVPTRSPARAAVLKTAGAVGQIVPLPFSQTDTEIVRAAIEGTDLVVNLTGILYEKRPGDFQRVHADLAGQIAAAARSSGTRHLVHLSALGTDLVSASSYARSKAEGERIVRATFPDATILRPSIIFGAEDNFFNRFAGMARLSPCLPLIGGGMTLFQPVYVGDVASAVMAALDTTTTGGGVWDLGGPRVYTMRRLMEIILEITGRNRWLVTVPWTIATALGSALGHLANPPLTSDQVELLRWNNVVTGSATLADFGIAPTALEVILPTYLGRFCRGGRIRTS